MPTIVLDDYEFLNLLGAFKRMRNLSRYGYLKFNGYNVLFDNGDWFNQVLYKLCEAVPQVQYPSLQNNFGDTFDSDALKKGRLHSGVVKRRIG